MKRIRVAIVGVGVMGQTHAHVYHKELSSEVELVGICDTNAEQGQKVATQTQSQFFPKYEDLIGKIDAVNIVVPTFLHHQVALFFLEHRVPILLEKPIASTVKEAEEIVQLAESTQTLLQIGHLERFNPVFTRLKEKNLKPAYIEAYRIAQFTPRVKDVGVVLDLMIHDIDIVLHITRSPIRQIQAVGVNIMGEHEDIANARIEFENGCVATLTASRISMKRERKIRLFGKNFYGILNYDQLTGQIIEKDPVVDGKWLLEHNITGISALNPEVLEVVGKLLKVDNFSLSHEERPLQKQLRSFIQCVRENKTPEVTGRDGLMALQTGVEICNQLERFKRHHLP
ncbi:MAG: Gfo/Idh/MocA family oxidoreductase [Planctomycetota bacterium]